MTTFKRNDGRKPDEVRKPIFAKVGVIPNADGSAMFQSGKTIAIAAVYGPKELHPRNQRDPETGTLRCNYNMLSFSVTDRIRPGPSRRSTEISEKKKDKNNNIENAEKNTEIEFPLKTNVNKESEKEKELDQDEIFKKLGELAGQSHEEVKKAVNKEEVSSKDLMKVFANVTSKKQIDTNVFKAILSQLMKTGQVSKQTVAEILFEFLDKELLTKKEVSDLVKELQLTAR